MNYYTLINVLLTISMLLCSCGHNRQIKHKVALMRKTTICLNTDSMLAFYDGDSMMNVKSDSALKIVVWADSTECSECYIRQLEMWKDYVKLECDNPRLFKIYFIIEIASNDIEKQILLLRDIQLNHTIYIDTAHCFRCNNPNIPSDVIYHTFLMNNDDKVILVGNPTKNRNIQTLFDKVINERLSISPNHLQ